MLVNFRGVECLTSNKPFDFGDDPDPEIFNRIITTAGLGQL